jgi:hypothetical protein
MLLLFLEYFSSVLTARRKVLFFASSREHIGRSTCALSLPCFLSARRLVDALLSQFPQYSLFLSLSFLSLTV